MREICMYYRTRFHIRSLIEVGVGLEGEVSMTYHSVTLLAAGESSGIASVRVGLSDIGSVLLSRADLLVKNVLIDSKDDRGQPLWCAMV